MNVTKYICHHCVGEQFLRRQIASTGTLSTCSYCGERANAFSIEEMADRIERAFEQHYRRTSEEPDTYERWALSDRESNYSWERHGDPVEVAIESAAEIPEDAARDIQQELEERHYDHDAAKAGEESDFASDAHYEEQAADGDHWRRLWSEFDHAIKTQARFFGHNAKELLSEIFSNLEQLSPHGQQPLIVDIGPGSACEALHRARVFQSEEPLKNALCRPDRELGPPPGPIAPAGRMNARGISVFYGATDPKVAIAEVRPPVRTRVVVAKFEILRPLRILDLRNLGMASADGSVFDEAFADLCHKAAFLQTLSNILCEPVVPDDEDLEYLPTQAIADFLATESDPILDGIAYPSTQIDDAGYNVVLFHKAARVEELVIPEGAELEASTGSHDEDGWYSDYDVTETLPLPPSLVKMRRRQESAAHQTIPGGTPGTTGNRRCASRWRRSRSTKSGACRCPQRRTRCPARRFASLRRPSFEPSTQPGGSPCRHALRSTDGRTGKARRSRLQRPALRRHLPGAAQCSERCALTELRVRY